MTDTLRDHVEEEVQKAQKWGDDLAWRLSLVKINARIGRPGEMTAGAAKGGISFERGNLIEFPKQKREGVGVYNSTTLMSVDSVRRMMNKSTSEAHGDSGWHDKTKSARLKFVADRLGKDKDNGNIMKHTMMFPRNAYEEMCEIIRKLAKDILDGDVKMHMPEYKIIVNAYTMAFYEAIGLKPSGSFNEWRKRSKNKERLTNLLDKIHCSKFDDTEHA